MKVWKIRHVPGTDYPEGSILFKSEHHNTLNSVPVWGLNLKGGHSLRVYNDRDFKELFVDTGQVYEYELSDEELGAFARSILSAFQA